MKKTLDEGVFGHLSFSLAALLQQETPKHPDFLRQFWQRSSQGQQHGLRWLKQHGDGSPSPSVVFIKSDNQFLLCENSQSSTSKINRHTQAGMKYFQCSRTAESSPGVIQYCQWGWVCSCAAPPKSGCAPQAESPGRKQLWGAWLTWQNSCFISDKYRK